MLHCWLFFPLFLYSLRSACIWSTVCTRRRWPPSCRAKYRPLSPSCRRTRYTTIRVVVVVKLTLLGPWYNVAFGCRYQGGTEDGGGRYVYINPYSNVWSYHLSIYHYPGVILTTPLTLVILTLLQEISYLEARLVALHAACVAGEVNKVRDLLIKHPEDYFVSNWLRDNCSVLQSAILGGSLQVRVV